MSVPHLLKYLYLAYFSRPVWLRSLYRAARRARVGSIVELGVGKGERTRRLIEIALLNQSGGVVRYTGVDLFESRPTDSPGLTLKNAHRILTSSGARVQLVPGDPYTALARTANAHRETDLLVISADQDAAALTKAWFYVPRMLHEGSLVFLEQVDPQTGEPNYRVLTRRETEILADEVGRRLPRAA